LRRARCVSTDFSCRPPNDISDTPIPPRSRAQGSRRTADQRGAKRQTSVRKREREKRGRTAWAKGRKKRAKAVSGPALADMGATAAATATAASRKGATAASKAAPAPPAAVAATYCEAAMATMPTAAAPRAKAEAATRCTRAVARKDVVATTTASSAGAVTSPSPPAPPAKRKRPQPVEPTSEQRLMGAIPQLDGDVSLGAETVSLPATPQPTTLPPLTTTPPPPSDPATIKSLCTSCNAPPIFNYERRICIECLEKLVCKKCFTTVSEYRPKNHFFKYMYDYCQVECNNEIYTR
jgi:hypothetical protein